MRKSDANLIRLRDLGVNDLYVGVECGLDVNSREEMPATLQDATDTIDEEHFAKTFRRDHI